MAPELAEKIVDALIADIEVRDHFGELWDAHNPEDREPVRAAWIEVVKNVD